MRTAYSPTSALACPNLVYKKQWLSAFIEERNEVWSRWAELYSQTNRMYKNSRTAVSRAVLRDVTIWIFKASKLYLVASYVSSSCLKKAIYCCQNHLIVYLKKILYTYIYVHTHINGQNWSAFPFFCGQVLMLNAVICCWSLPPM